MKRKLPQVLEPLIKLPHWVIWKWVLNDKERWTKPPFQSLHPARHASTTDRVTWSTYDEACESAPSRNTKDGGGIGFVLKGSGIGAIDIDNCLTDEGEVFDELEYLMKKSYVEVTPSMRGIRVIGLTRGPSIKQEHIKLARGSHAEVYRDCNRYITVTGYQMTYPAKLEYIDDLIDKLVDSKPPDESSSPSSAAKDKSPSGLFYAQVLRWAEQRWSVERMVKELTTHVRRYAHTSVARYIEQDRLQEEVERVISNAGVTTRGESDGDQWQMVTGRELVAGYRPPDYLIEGLLQRGFLYSLTGRTGSGKTAMMLYLAALVGGHVGISNGKKVMDGREVERGRVVYFAGENPDDIRMRWIAMADYFGFSFDSVDVHFVLGRVSLNGDIDRIRAKVHEIGGAQLVIVDTAIAYFEGDDENSNAQMSSYAREYLRPLTTLTGRPCVVVNCHPAKNVAEDNLQPRGGGAFVTEVDTNLVATRHGEFCELHWQTKIRGSEFNPVKFEFVPYAPEVLKDSKGRRINTILARSISDERYEVKTRDAREWQDEVFEVIVNNPGISISKIAMRLELYTSTGLPDKSKIYKAITQLQKDKLLHRSRGILVPVKAGKKREKSKSGIFSSKAEKNGSSNLHKTQERPVRNGART